MAILDKILGKFRFDADNKSRPLAALQTLGSLLTDQQMLAELLERGFVKLPFLEAKELEPIIQNLLKFNELRGGKSSALFYTSGRDELKARAAAKALSWPFVKDYLPRIINPNGAHMEGCAWLIKPPGDQGSLSPHQDSSLIDETRFASLYGWMPLQDVTAENGTIHVIPGSHRWGIHFRSLDVPLPLEGHTELLLQHSIPIEMKAGEMLLFEGALIHGSSINTTQQMRAALNFFFRPKAAQMLHFMKDAQTPVGKVEAFEIDADFFQEHDFRKRPDTNIYPFHKMYEQPQGIWPEKKVLRAIRMHATKA